MYEVVCFPKQGKHKGQKSIFQRERFQCLGMSNLLKGNEGHKKYSLNILLSFYERQGVENPHFSFLSTMQPVKEEIHSHNLNVE